MEREIYDTKKEAMKSKLPYIVELCGYNSAAGTLNTWWVATDSKSPIDTRGQCMRMDEECWEISRTTNKK